MQTAIAGRHQPPGYHAPLAGLESPHIHDVLLHHLRHADDIASIVDLRDEIDLSVHSAAGRQHFEQLEKKETSPAWFSVSSSPANGSARSGLCLSGWI